MKKILTLVISALLVISLTLILIPLIVTGIVWHIVGVRGRRSYHQYYI